MLYLDAAPAVSSLYVRSLFTAMTVRDESHARCGKYCAFSPMELARSPCVVISHGLRQEVLSVSPKATTGPPAGWRHDYKRSQPRYYRLADRPSRGSNPSQLPAEIWQRRRVVFSMGRLAHSTFLQWPLPQPTRRLALHHKICVPVRMRRRKASGVCLGDQRTPLVTARRLLSRPRFEARNGFWRAS